MILNASVCPQDQLCPPDGTLQDVGADPGADSGIPARIPFHRQSGLAPDVLHSRAPETDLWGHSGSGSGGPKVRSPTVCKNSIQKKI